MKSLVAEAPPSDGVDRSWHKLFTAGGWCGMLVVVPYLVAIGLVSVAPPPLAASGAATLEYVASHKWLYSAEQALWIAPGVLTMVVFLALTAALWRVDKAYAAIAGLVGVSAWAVTLALPTSGGGAPALVYLADQYDAATSAAQRAVYATVAEGYIAENNTPSVVGVLGPAGILLISLVMAKGVFARWVAYFGVATGAIGVVSEALRPVLGAAYTVYGILLLVWLFAAGKSLHRLGRYTNTTTAVSDARGAA